MKNSKLTKAILAVVAIAAMVMGCTRTQEAFEPEYIGGYPTEETAERMFEEYDYQAATQFYVWAYTMLNNIGMSKGYEKMGGDERSIYTFDKRIQPQHVVMTANTEVVYNWTRLIDLSKGPVVLVAPPKTRGVIYDISCRGLVDTGDQGPDKGQGGKYLVLPHDYDGEIPDGYFPVYSKWSNLVMSVVRSFPAAEGGDEGAVQRGGEMKWYYLSEAANPPENTQVLIGDRPYSQDWPRDAEAFVWIAESFNRDIVPESAKAHLGNMRRLGLIKGQPFAPDERAQRILERAAKTGKGIVLSMAFYNRQKFTRVYEDRQYDSIFYVRNPQFFEDYYEEVEGRTGSWHQLVGNPSEYIPATPGTGAFYMNTFRDSDGNLLMGQNSYRLRVPPEVPVAQFWQIPVYDVERRAMIRTDQNRPALSGTDDLIKNTDGSIDIYFGPEAPDEYEQNWIKTIPGEGWFTLPRLFGPLEPVLDKTWRWNDIEKIK